MTPAVCTDHTRNTKHIHTKRGVRFPTAAFPGPPHAQLPCSVYRCCAGGAYQLKVQPTCAHTHTHASPLTCAQLHDQPRSEHNDLDVTGHAVHRLEHKGWHKRREARSVQQLLRQDNTQPMPRVQLWGVCHQSKVAGQRRDVRQPEASTHKGGANPVGQDGHKER